MKTLKGKASKYLSQPPKVSVSKDKKTGLFYAKFTLDKKYSKPTGARNERAAKAQATKIRDDIWNAWRESLSSVNQANTANTPVHVHVGNDDESSLDKDDKRHGSEEFKEFTPKRITSRSLVKVKVALESPKGTPNIKTQPYLMPIVKLEVANPLGENKCQVDQQTSLVDGISAFLDDYKNDPKTRITKSSVHAVRGILNMWEKSFPYRYMEEITLERLQAFQAIAEKRWAKRTYNSIHTYTKKFLKWGFKKGVLHCDFHEWEFIRTIAYGGIKNDKNAKWSKDLFDWILRFFDIEDQKALRVC